MFVPFSGNRRPEYNPGIINASIAIPSDITMRRIWSDCEEERFLSFNSVVEEAVSLCRENVGGVLAHIADRGFMISLEARVQILISVGIEQEVGTGEALNEWLVIVVDIVGVEQFAGVVRVVASSL
jgi:hypothetical protein